MSRPRLLTDPDEVAASAEFKRCLLASKKKQEAVAAEIGEGVTQGTVWQWANGRLAIPASRARDAARAVGADPLRISVAWRQLNAAPRFLESVEPVVLPSQRVGIPISTIADALKVVRIYLDDRGDPVGNGMDPVLIKAALDLVIEAAEPLSIENVIAFKRRFEERVREVRDGVVRGQAAGVG